MEEGLTTALHDKVSTAGTIHCKSDTQRQCIDGSCIAKADLCPEEEIMSQDSILIMIGVGMGVVIFLIMLYCLQQRRNANNSEPALSLSFDDTAHPELMIPPPSYEEALNVNVYPPTPEMHRSRRLLSVEEPRTPPPNYDTALHILAQSHEALFVKESKPPTPVMRRSISLDFLSLANRRPISSPPRIAGFRQTNSNPGDGST